MMLNVRYTKKSRHNLPLITFLSLKTKKSTYLKNQHIISLNPKLLSRLYESPSIRFNEKFNPFFKSKEKYTIRFNPLLV
jgi:hypothetical protein